MSGWDSLRGAGRDSDGDPPGEEAPPPRSGSSSIRELFDEADTGFNDVIDYIRKAPAFLDAQEKVTRETLDAHLPRGDAVGEARRMDESRKFSRVLPVLMASGNLSMSVSLFEMYLFRLGMLLDGEGTALLRDLKGPGVYRSIAYLDQLGLEPRRAALWPQVEAALRFRGCLMHGGGLLAYSREEAALAQLVAGRGYLEERIRHNPDPWARVSIVATDAGDRLEITNNYAWQAAKYLRTYFQGLCRAAVARFPGAAGA